MSQPVIVRKMDLEEWNAIGVEFYGEDRMNWEFSCPNCKLTLSFNKYLEKKAQLKGWQPYTECVGRYLKDEGCDWAAYGLFNGPREITENNEHRAYAFYFAKETAV